MTNDYPVSDREKARHAFKQINDLALQAKQTAERGLVLPADTERIMQAITQTSDMSVRVSALTGVADDLRKQHLDKLKILAPHEFAAFCEYVSPDEPPESPWHQYLTGLLQQIETDPAMLRLILNVPPGHAKSTYASRLYVAWRLGRDPDQRIIGGGHSQRFVENEMSKKIRSLVGSQPYNDIFPNVVIDHGTRAADQWAIAGRRGQYVAKGVGQGIHGFRATFICVDDPYSKIEDAESPTKRETVNTWFITDIGSRLLPFGKAFLIMTRFHDEDLTGHLLEMNPRLAPEHRWLHIEIPAICYDPITDKLNRKLGQVLWEYYDLGYFKTKKTELTFSRFALMYQQLADATSDNSVVSHFKYYEFLPHKTPEAIAKARDAGSLDDAGNVIVNRKDYFRKVVLSVDTASKDTERSDYTVVQCWGETYNRKYYLFDQKRVKVDFNKMIETIESMARKYNVDSILVEDKGSGTTYIQARGTTDYQTRKAPAILVPINPGTQSKTFRFDEVSPMIREGDVYLPQGAPWIELYLRELGQFPDGAHDDQVDATSQVLKYFKLTRTRFGSKKIGSMG